jgi:hypothetical protein
VKMSVDNGVIHSVSADKDCMVVLVQKQTPYATARKEDTISFTDDVSEKVPTPESLPALSIHFLYTKINKIVNYSVPKVDHVFRPYQITCQRWRGIHD